MKTIHEMLTEKAAKAANGNWASACGGTEEPFTTRTGARLLYCYQATTGLHAYLNLGTDLILSNEEASNLLAMS